MRPIPRRLLALVLAGPLLAGCAIGSSGVSEGGLPRGLAATPNATVPPIPPTKMPGGHGDPSGKPQGGATGGASGSGSGPGSGSGTGTGTGGGSSGSSGSGGSTSTTGGTGSPSPEPLAPFHSIGRVSDRAGDQQGSGPAWADLSTIDIADNGTYARVTVVVAGRLPGHVPADNTLGIGVDFFRAVTQTEGQYQLFVDGRPDGWFAYLHGPRRYVRYPGTFAVGGRSLVFTVPWSALGNHRSGRFSAFADWSRSAVGRNPYSEDHAPALINASYG